MRSTSRPEPVSAMVITRVLASSSEEVRMAGWPSGIGSLPRWIYAIDKKN